MYQRGTLEGSPEENLGKPWSKRGLLLAAAIAIAFLAIMALASTHTPSKKGGASFCVEQMS